MIAIRKGQAGPRRGQVGATRPVAYHGPLRERWLLVRSPSHLRSQMGALSHSGSAERNASPGCGWVRLGAAQWSWEWPP